MCSFKALVETVSDLPILHDLPAALTESRPPESFLDAIIQADLQGVLDLLKEKEHSVVMAPHTSCTDCGAGLTIARSTIASAQIFTPTGPLWGHALVLEVCPVLA